MCPSAVFFFLNFGSQVAYYGAFWGPLPLLRFFFNFWVSNCIFWGILGAILRASLLLDILHNRPYMVTGTCVARLRIYFML